VTRSGQEIVGAGLAAARTWLIEPADPQDDPATPPPSPTRSRPVIAVYGLARGCGATVVARALAAELASGDSGGAAAVACAVRSGAVPLATPAAARLARALADLPGSTTHAVGRLCLVDGVDRLALADCARFHAPLVLDAGSSAIGGASAAMADRTIVVGAPGVEPALAAVAASCLARVGPEPIVVLNRSCPGHGWADRPAVELPDARMGAQLALAGREPRGRLGRAVAALAHLTESTP